MSPAHDARYDSSFSDKIERGGCLHNTRVSVLEGIRGWTYNDGNAKIHWTNGMAGTGKTTIAYSVCSELEHCGRLGASFFCSRASPECRDVSRILPTIAYQLAQQFYPFRSSLCRILGKQPNIGQRSVTVQFDCLIKAPLLEVKDVLPNDLVVVIDALDECSEPKAVEMVLNALFCHAANLPIRFFLTSRPEPSIAGSIIARNEQSRSILQLHNVEQQLVKADIRTYLAFTLANLSLCENENDQLADKAGVLFIHAATIARYLLTGRGTNTSTRLLRILAGGTKECDKKDREIDQLYKTILEGAFGDGLLEEEEEELIKRVLWTVVYAGEPVSKTVLSALLAVDCEQVSDALQPLLSVIHVSKDSGVVSTLHASFLDFMISSKRAGLMLYCNERAHNKYLAIRCFELMREQLKFNICGLKSSYLFDKDVPDISNWVNSTVSLELFYACRYWADHLRKALSCEELLACLGGFLHERLLFWMEVLSLISCSSDGAKILGKAQA